MNGNSGTASASRPPSFEDRGRLIDDFLRRALRIGNPRNPVEVAEALRIRYADAAGRIDQEAAGLPVGGAVERRLRPLSSDAAPADSMGDRELRRVRDALDTDLSVLVDSPANREWRLDLAGWRTTLLRELDNGAGAARMGEDPARRDRAFLAIRVLGEYARISRLVGVVHLEMIHAYRRLATTLDDAASVVRILVGEALYGSGLGDGGVILNVPLVDLRQRGDALLQTLRQLTATGPEASGDFGDGLGSYGALLERIDAESAPELKIYLREETLSRVLDDLVDDISSAVEREDPEALRRLGATLPVEATRFNQLLAIGSQVAKDDPDPKAAPSVALSRFVHALNLFVQAFRQTRSGARLIDLAVPLAMAANQSDEADGDARKALRDLVSLRAEFAREADCFLSCCGRDDDDLRTQVKIDKVLYHLDRAIDLYAQGEGRAGHWGDEEKRAAACGVIAGNLANQAYGDESPEVAVRVDLNFVRGRPLSDTLKTILNSVKGLLTAALPPASAERKSLLDSIIKKEWNYAEQDWQSVAASLAPRCIRAVRDRGTIDETSLLDAGFELLFYNPSSQKERLPRDIPLPMSSPLISIARSGHRMADLASRLASSTGALEKHFTSQVEGGERPAAARAENVSREAISESTETRAPARELELRKNLEILLDLADFGLVHVAQETLTLVRAKDQKVSWNDWIDPVLTGSQIHGAVKKAGMRVPGGTIHGWNVLRPGVVETYGDDFADKVDALLSLMTSDEKTDLKWCLSRLLMLNALRRDIGSIQRREAAQ